MYKSFLPLLLTFNSLWKVSGAAPRYTGDKNSCMEVNSDCVSCPSCARIPSTTNRNFFFSKLNMIWEQSHHTVSHSEAAFGAYCYHFCSQIGSLTECHFPSLYFSLLKISFSLPTDSLILPLEMYTARWARPPLVAAKNSSPSEARVLTSKEK